MGDGVRYCLRGRRQADGARGVLAALDVNRVLPVAGGYGGPEECPAFCTYDCRTAEVLDPLSRPPEGGRNRVLCLRRETQEARAGQTLLPGRGLGGRPRPADR